VDILTKAFEEESGDLRVAAIEALAHIPDPKAITTLERAYNSHVVAERYAAIDGASRHADIALLERATRDTDTAVALAAAYGLHVAHRDDLIEKSLANRNDARANEIRRLLPLLSIRDA
jgi:HEAT repeat protein